MRLGNYFCSKLEANGQDTQDPDPYLGYQDFATCSTPEVDPG